MASGAVPGRTVSRGRLERGFSLRSLRSTVGGFEGSEKSRYWRVAALAVRVYRDVSLLAGHYARGFTARWRGASLSLLRFSEELSEEKFLASLAGYARSTL